LAPRGLKSIPPRLAQVEVVWGRTCPLEVLESKGTKPEALFLAALTCPYGVMWIEDVDPGEQLYL